MNEPKKRGRPSKADVAARETAQVPHVSGETAREPEPVTQEHQMPQEPAEDLSAKAQAYALRIWSGQSPSLGRSDRIARVMRALEGQSLPFEGVKLPGSSNGDDDEWTDADYAPVTFKTKRDA